MQHDIPSDVKQLCDIYNVRVACVVRPEKNFDTQTIYSSGKGTIAVSVLGQPSLADAMAAIESLKNKALTSA